MKNLLLLTILLGTIACQGSNGPGAPIVKKGPNKTITEYPVFTDVYGTNLQQCKPEENETNIIECVDNGKLRPLTEVEHFSDVACGDPTYSTNVKLPVDTNVDRYECADKNEDRPYEYTEKYWPSIGCTEINTTIELKECGSERVKSQDVSHLEGLDNLYITNNSFIAVFSDMVDIDGYRGKVTSTTTSLTIKPSYIDGNGDWIITLYNDGTFDANYLESDNILSSNIVSWWIEDELLVIETPSGLTKLRGSRE